MASVINNMNETNNTNIATENNSKKSTNSNLIWGVLIIVLGILFMGGLAWTYLNTVSTTANTATTADVKAQQPTTAAQPTTMQQQVNIEEQVAKDNQTAPKEVGNDIIKDIDQINNESVDASFSETQLNDVN